MLFMCRLTIVNDGLLHHRRERNFRLQRNGARAERDVRTDRGPEARPIRPAVVARPDMDHPLRRDRRREHRREFDRHLHRAGRPSHANGHELLFGS